MLAAGGRDEGGEAAGVVAKGGDLRAARRYRHLDQHHRRPRGDRGVDRPGLRPRNARVLDIPTPRWTAYDAAYFKVQTPKDIPMTTQDRAWTSPIWYTPAS
jgi:hypothetical protein